MPVKRSWVIKSLNDATCAINEGKPVMEIVSSLHQVADYLEVGMDVSRAKRIMPIISEALEQDNIGKAYCYTGVMYQELREMFKMELAAGVFPDDYE